MNHGVGAFRPPHLINVICKKHGDSHKKYYKKMNKPINLYSLYSSDYGVLYVKKPLKVA